MSLFAAGLRPVIYTAYVKDNANTPAETAEFVREGFNWLAFVFGPFWAAYHRAWSLLILLIALNIGLSTLEYVAILSPTQTMLVQLFFQIMLGFEANDFLGNLLRKRGYILVDIVCGDTPLRAQLRFLERYFARVSSQPVSSALPHAHVALRSPWSSWMSNKEAK